MFLKKYLLKDKISIFILALIFTFFIFGKDGGKNIASKFNIELLGQIPININLRKNSDEGTPFVDQFKDDKVSKLFLEIANKITKIIK